MKKAGLFFLIIFTLLSCSENESEQNNSTTNGGQVPADIDFTASLIWSNHYTEELYLTDDKGNLFISTDNANNWQYIRRLPFNNKFELIIVGEFLYGSDGAFIYISEDKGETWNQLNRPEANDEIKSFNVNINSKEIYVATEFALFKYEGGTWDRIFTLSSSSYHSSVAIDLNGTIFYSTYATFVHISEDDGQNWKTYDVIVKNTNITPTSTTGSFYVTDENIVLGNTWHSGIWKFENETFQSLSNGIVGISNLGLTANYTVTLNSNYYTWITSSYDSGKGIFYSSDKGNSWNNITNNITQYDLRYGRLYLSINSEGNVFCSIPQIGCYILSQDKTEWQRIE